MDVNALSFVNYSDLTQTLSFHVVEPERIVSIVVLYRKRCSQT